MSNQREYRAKYLRGALDLWNQAVQLQSQRCQNVDADARTSRIDINFYIVSVKRLREVAFQTVQRFDLDELREPLRQFDERWPNFAELRNRQEHYRDPTGGYPSDTWYFTGSVVDLKPGGRVEYVVDVETMGPWAERLYDAAVSALDAEVQRLETRAA